MMFWFKITNHITIDKNVYLKHFYKIQIVVISSTSMLLLLTINKVASQCKRYHLCHPYFCYFMNFTKNADKPSLASPTILMLECP